MAIRLFIDGAAGTTGLEIRQRLEGREEFDLITLDESQRKSPEARQDALRGADIAILCLPDEAARQAVALIGEADTRVIDASSAHRTAPGWTYGFPEIIGREAIERSTRVSNPGCYPTGFLALVVPLVRAGLIAHDWPITVNAVSGYSGGGKALIERFEAPGAPAYRAYGYDLSHKHLPEMTRHAGLARKPVFSPAVVPTYRGMIVEVPLALSALESRVEPQAIREELARFYRDSAVVLVKDETDAAELLLEREAPPSDAMELFVFADLEGEAARLVARLDNLGKGASGAAIQNLNIMCGFEETRGLQLADNGDTAA